MLYVQTWQRSSSLDTKSKKQRQPTTFLLLIHIDNWQDINFHNLKLCHTVFKFILI